jgi:hypothetical protein
MLSCHLVCAMSALPTRNAACLIQQLSAVPGLQHLFLGPEYRCFRQSSLQLRQMQQVASVLGSMRQLTFPACTWTAANGMQAGAERCSLAPRSIGCTVAHSNTCI